MVANDTRLSTLMPWRIAGMKAWSRRSPVTTLAIASFLAILISVSGAVSAGEVSDIALVVSNDWSGIDAITLPDLRKVYLGKRKTLKGSTVEPWQQQGNSSIRLAFDEAVLAKAKAEIDDYWIQQALLGEARPPKTARSFAAMLDRVRRKAGAMGYVDAERLRAEPQAGIKMLPVIVNGKPLLPGDCGYPLKH